MMRANEEDWSGCRRRFGGNHRLHHHHWLFKRFPVRSACSDMAITRKQAVGLLRWQHRLVRAGWRAAQTSNAYELLLTENPPETLRAARLRCGGQAVRQTCKRRWWAFQLTSRVASRSRSTPDGQREVYQDGLFLTLFDDVRRAGRANIAVLMQLGARHRPL